MSRSLTALALIIAGCVAVAGLSAFPGCGYRGPSAESHPEAGGFPPPGGLKIEVPVKTPYADRDGDGKVSSSEANEDAKNYFRESVKKWAAWIIGAIGLATVGMYVASFFVLTIPRAACGIGIALMAATSFIAYVLLKIGVLAGDILAWSLIGILIMCIAGGAWTLALWWKRWILLQQGKALTVQAIERGETPRDGVALMAAGSTVVSKERKGIVEAFEKAKNGPEFVNVVKASLRDKGINL